MLCQDGPRNTSVEFVRPGLGAGTILSSIGCRGFEGELSRFLADLLGPHELHLFRMRCDSPDMLASISSDGSAAAQIQSRTYVERRVWQFDSALQGLVANRSESPALCRVDAGRPTSRELKSYYDAAELRERILVIGGPAHHRMALAVVRRRQHGGFEPGHDERINLLETFAFPLMARHFALLSREEELSTALTSLATIENCLARATESFPKRESEVVARILYGMSTEGVALDLGIGTETVICYRRRFYQRTGISCFRELVVWYLALFAARPTASLIN